MWLCDSRHWADHCAGKKHEISSRRQNVVSIDSSGASAQQRIELRDLEAGSSNVNPGSGTHSEAAATMCDDKEQDMDPYYCDVCNMWLCSSRHWADHCEGTKHAKSCRRQNVVSIYSSSGAPAPQRSDLRDLEARSSNVNPGSDTHSEAAATMCNPSSPRHWRGYAEMYAEDAERRVLHTRKQGGTQRRPHQDHGGPRSRTSRRST